MSRRIAAGWVFALLFGMALVVAGTPMAAAAERPLLPGIVGPDDRTPVDSSAWPWQAIGRLNRKDGGHCTATLIAADAVLTAAHCLYDVRTQRIVAPQELHFLAGYRRGEFFAHGIGRKIERAGGEIPALHLTPESITQDWAIIVLQQPLTIRPLAIRPLTPAEAIKGISLWRAGYSQDRPHMLSVHRGCTILEHLAEGRVLLTDCDATRGDSGSPLLIAAPGEAPAIAGLTSAVAINGAEPGTLAVDARVFRDACARHIRTASPAIQAPAGEPGG
ncbi:MAG: trypsin-like serine protease [Rhodospirillales bacterium]|nr:trypsin-like serine protease [Rhodospirillales bacterium]